MTESKYEEPAQAAPGQPTGKWYFVVTLASAGLLAAVPFFHAASVLHKAALRKVGAGYAVVALVGFMLMGLAPKDQDGNPTGLLGNFAVVVLLAVVVGATLQQIGLRQDVYGRRRLPVAGAGNLTAIELVELARSKRQEARALAQRDPLMARELRIGRPDLPRDYDDGGLVDLNSASTEAIAEVCQVPMSTAEHLVALREELGRFSSVEEAIVYADASGDSANGIRERGLVVAPMKIGD